MKIYCDGSCLNNPGFGGWAAILIKRGFVVKKICGFDEYTSNNKMELMASIQALIKIIKNHNLHIFTDSNYLQLGITEWIKNWKLNNWKNRQIKNIDLWMLLDRLNLSSNISWHWVKSHNGDKYNEIVDKLAKNAVTNNITLY